MKNFKINKSRPSVLKSKNILIVFIFVLILAFAMYLGTLIVKNTGLIASIQSAFLVSFANEDRQEKNISTLTVSPLLVEAAQKKANDMAKKGYFAHTSPEGLSPWYWFENVGYDYAYAGENLAVNFQESEDVHNAWIDSESHKRNILDKHFTEIGVATAEGLYKGEKATFVVQMFGRPR